MQHHWQCLFATLSHSTHWSRWPDGRI